MSMRSRLAAAALLLGAAAPARAQEAYGAKGLFPVYETSGQWVVFDKRPNKQHPTPIGAGEKFLVIGSEGAELFEVKRTSGTYGGLCRGHKPLKLRAGLLVGPRRKVGRPIMGIHVPETFTLKGSRARYAALGNEVSDATYQKLGPVLQQAAPSEAGKTPQTKIDFGSRLGVAGVKDGFLLVEETELGASTRRCLRLADGDKLVGACAEMPRALMAETALLQFVSYDPSGRGNPYVLAYTKTTPLWGDERWGFVVRENGPRLFLMDAMDVRCREGF